MTTKSMKKKTEEGLLGRLRKSRGSRESPTLPTDANGKRVNFDPEYYPALSKTREGHDVITSQNGEKYKASEVRDDELVKVVVSEKRKESRKERKQKEKLQLERKKRQQQIEAEALKQELARNRISRPRETMVLQQPPSSKVSAFFGPPRYDWIDIETSAAIKVQAAYRRNKVFRDLEKRGVSTAAMRNQARARNARQRRMAGEDVPSAFRFCGIGFLFGDVTEEDQKVKEAYLRQEWEEKIRKKQAEEEAKRKYRFRKKSSPLIEEGVEVVEELE